MLCREKVEISLNVKGLDAGQFILENWFISGNVQVYLGG